MIRSRGGTKYPYAWAVTVTGRDGGTWGRPWERRHGDTALRAEARHILLLAAGAGSQGEMSEVKLQPGPGVTIGGGGGQCGQFAASVAQICHYIIY